MQNYTQQPPGYQRPGSTASFVGQPATAPPPYGGAQQGLQSASPHQSSPWAPPAQNQPNQQQWAQSPQTQQRGWGQQQQQQQQQQTGGYNPSVYGAMPGAYAHGQPASISQSSNPYNTQPQDQPPPPPPPPKPYALSQQQQPSQIWQQPSYEAQPLPQGYPPHQPQSGYPPQGGFQAQQPYSNTAPPPPSATPGGSYFPPSQHGQYSVDQSGSGAYPTSTPASATTVQAPSSVLTPDAQHPTYIPPSLTGQGVQSYMPANTNPLPGVYVPPPPDMPAWQQASHAPLQGSNKKFRYTKPMVDPSYHAQGYQQPFQQLGQFGQQADQGQQYEQNVQGQYQGQGQIPQQAQFGQSLQNQQLQDQFPQQQYDQALQSGQHYSQQVNQWQQPSPVNQGFAQFQQHQVWQSQQPPPLVVEDQGIQTPKPFNGGNGTTAPHFASDPSPQSQPVSPVQNRNSMSFVTSNVGRTDSVSSIALSAIQSQRAGNRISYPATSSKVSAPPALPTTQDPKAFSALGLGGPSDWEHFGGVHEIDDEELFGVKKQEVNSEIVHTDSIELPAHVPSPPPSPPSQPAPLNIEREDTYQPTPPPDSTYPARPQEFIVDDAPALPQSPEPSQFSQPPLDQQFTLRNGHESQQYSQQSPAGWAPSEQVPSLDPGWGEDAQIQGQYQNQNSGAELQERLRSDAEREKVDLRTEMDRLRSEADREKADLRAELKGLRSLSTELEKLRTDLEHTKSLAASEKNTLDETIEKMKIAEVKSKSTFEAVNKEKVSTIERLKEDAEGKDDTIKERDATIADLKRQLEAERANASKPVEIPQPTPRDLIPDIDPWYAGSLERYIGMLRSEASEQHVDGKISTFTAFLRVESSIRGLKYYSAPPLTAPLQDVTPNAHAGSFGLSRGASNASIKKLDVNVQIPQHQQPLQDEFQCSPGGRPLLQQKPTMSSTENVSRAQSLIFSSGSEEAPLIQTASDVSQKQATILTPTSSTDGTFNKGPIQSPPEESTGQYKAFVPPVHSQSASVNSLHRRSISFSPSAYVAPIYASKSSKDNDEIFFGAQTQEKSPKPASRPATSDSTVSDVPLPAPLSLTPAPLSVASQSLATAPSPKIGPVEVLRGMIPAQIIPRQPHPRLGPLWKRSTSVPSDLSRVNALTVAWEKAAAVARSKNEMARRKRQEESEEHNNQLFDNEEISYAEIGDLEDEFKEEERELKAREDKEEYQTYVEQVFDKVYDGLQADITSLMDLYTESKNLLHTSISGVKTMDGKGDAPSTHEALELVKTLHAQTETRHDRVAQAVAERDKRYKRTEIQPLYAAGNIAKMKNVEKHFDNAEKQAASRVKGERSKRIGELVRDVEEIVIAAVGHEQDEADHILDIAKGLAQDNATGEYTDILTRARDTLLAIKASSVALLDSYNSIEIEHNTAQLETELAQAISQNLNSARIKELERELREGEKKMKEDFGRRVGVLEQDRRDIEGLVEGALNEEERAKREKEKRLKTALEEAKRRNGHT